MRKQIHRLILALALLFCVFALPGVKAKAFDADVYYENPITDYKVMIRDDAGLFTAEELSRLAIEDMYPLTAWGDIFLYTVDKNSYGSTERLAEVILNSYNNADATGFFIDMDERQVRIQSSGKNDNKAFENKSQSITDNIYRYAGNAEWYECAHRAFEQLYKVNNGQRINEPMRYISAAFLAVAIALLGNFVALKISTVNWDEESSDLLKNVKNAHYDVPNLSRVLLKTKRVYSPPSSSSSGGHSGGGGGHSGGGGGGGHSSGGGHSF